MAAILIYTKEPQNMEQMIQKLEQDSHTYICCGDISGISSALEQTTIDLMLLEAPLITAKEIMAAIPSNLPLIVLVRNGIDDHLIIQYLEAGAWDVVSIYCTSGELNARINAMVRRSQLQNKNTSHQYFERHKQEDIP